MKPVIAITHAEFDEARRGALRDLAHQLAFEAPDVHFFVAPDADRRGSLWCWRLAMSLALIDEDVTHIVWLPDDAIVCRDFGRILTACIEARPDDVFDCYVSHARYGQLAQDARANWYSTPDGYTGVGGVMPRALLQEHLRWRDEMKLDEQTIENGQPYPNDVGVNLWAMATKRVIYKTAWTLVQHRTDIPSLEGRDAHPGRTGAFWVDDVRRVDLVNGESLDHFLARTYAAGRGEQRSCVPCPRSFVHHHWDVIKRLPPPWPMEHVYDLARGGPVSDHPSVFIATPTYGELATVKMKTDESRNKVTEDLISNGVTVSRYESAGESLISRVRQRIVHAFLKSPATHLLWWDCDIEALDPTCVRKMLETGHDFVAGACPFKDNTGRVVCNPLPEDLERGSFQVVNGCVEVQDAGSGFCLVSRKALIAVIEAHPELLHFSLHDLERGEPLFAIYETATVNRTYLSEDYFFCYLWQKLGGAVHVYVPATFRHYGMHAYEGSFVEQYGLVEKTA